MLVEDSRDVISIVESGEFDVVVHGCNCFCVQGAGIAKALRKYPEVYAADKATVAGDSNKLGKWTKAKVYTNKGETWIVNLYSQYKYGRDRVHTDYFAIDRGLKRLAEKAAGKRIAISRIGCGLAGGDWNVVSEIILRHIPNAVIYGSSESNRRLK